MNCIEVTNHFNMFSLRSCGLSTRSHQQQQRVKHIGKCGAGLSMTRQAPGKSFKTKRWTSQCASPGGEEQTKSKTKTRVCSAAALRHRLLWRQHVMSGDICKNFGSGVGGGEGYYTRKDSLEVQRKSTIQARQCRACTHICAQTHKVGCRLGWGRKGGKRSHERGWEVKR